MIKTSAIKNSFVEAALYYVQLKTHNSYKLFDVPAVQQDDLSQKTSQTGLASSLAQVAVDELLLAADCREITVEQWAVFPDALHALVVLSGERCDRRPTAGKPRRLTSFVAGFKAATATRINLLRNQPGSLVWQRSYQEQLIDDAAALARLKKRMYESKSIMVSRQCH